MKHKAKNNIFHQFYRLSALSVFGILVLAGATSTFPGITRAADSFKNAPVGVADYCRLEGTTTVIYGWAHDSQAGATNNPWVNVTAAGKTVRVATNIEGYRDAQINKYLQDNNYKTASKYGFKASFTGMYKGSSPALSGRIENVQEGSNQNLRINTGTAISSGPPDKYYFTGSRIPDACLPPAPIVSSPSTPSTPTTSIPSTTPTTSPRRTSSTTKTPSAAAPQNSQSTPQSPTTITEPYSLSLQLTDGETPLPDITVALQEAEQETQTDGNGNVVFKDLSQNQYTVAFTYNDEAYEHVVSVFEADPAGIITKTINIADLEPLSKTTAEDAETVATVSEEPSPLRVPVLIAVAAIILSATIFIILKKRSQIPTPSQKLYNVSPAQSAAPAGAPASYAPPQPTTSHAGVSLKDLVLESMREEAARRQQQR